MSNVTITNLPSTTAVQSTDKIPAVQNGTTVYVTASQIADYTQSTYAYGPAIAAGFLIGNPTPAPAVPVATSYSGLMDIALGSTQGQIMYRGATNWQALNPGIVGQVLRSGGPNGDPSWSTVSGTGTVYSITMGTNMVSTQDPLITTGTISVSTTPTFNSLTLNTPLTVDNGGTGLSSITQYGILYGNNTGALQTITPPTGTNYVLVGSSTGTFAWQENIPVTAGVNTVSFGTTGLTPNTPTEGDIVVAGTLVVANGGTGATTAPGGLANLTTYETTSAASQTLTNTSPYYQYYTGTTTTVTLPVTSTLSLGWSFHMVNNGSGNVTVNSSGGNLVATILPQMTAHVTCILTSGTTAASWDAGYTDFGSYTGSGAVVLATSPTISTSLAVSGTETITSSSATALVVGPNGTTNPTLRIDTVTASSATGIQIKSAAAGNGLAITTLSSGTNENLTLDAKGSGTITIAGTSTGNISLARATNVTGNLGVTGTITGTSSSASALSIGANGATNPALLVDASTASSATGISIKSAAAAGGAAIAVISSGINENLTINAKGSGTITLASTSTGNISLQNSTSITGTATVTSTAVSALAVGANGTTNPALTVDASTASSATGISIKSAAAASGVAIAVTSSGTNENLTIDAKGNGTITLGNTSTGAIRVQTNLIVTSTLSTAFAVGRAGSVNPAFIVDASTLSSATGINVKSAAAGGGVAVSVVSSGTNENLTIDAKGSGTITVGNTSTGAIALSRDTTVTSTLTATTLVATAGAGFQNMVVQTTGTAASYSLPAALQVTNAKFKVTVVGGGGQGGGTAATAGLVGGGGGGGGVIVVFLTYVAGQNTLTYTVGTGGSGAGTNAAGTAGTASSIVYNSVTYTAGGGGGGPTAGTTGSGTGGTATGGTLNIVGQIGNAGGTSAATANMMGAGGNAGLGLGYGAPSPSTSGTGTAAASGYGGGGSGGWNGATATARAGGAGAAGVVIIEY